MPRFVILEHDHPLPHFDLMLEAGSVLWTWRLPEWPQPGVLLKVQRLGDHRLAYLEYEGPVSGNRGTVIRRDQGAFVLLNDDPATLEVRLEGRILQGVIALVHEENECWSLTWLR